jgi:flagellar protein FliO/FliZ
MPGKPSTRGIAVRETMMISPGVKLAVVDFEGRRLLVSVNRAGVTLVDKSDVRVPVEPGQ